jgi:NADPH:quinone reductase-like Zn-dependent oxidoreductase
MKALVFEEPRQAVVSDLDTPAIAADEVLVRSLLLILRPGP